MRNLIVGLVLAIIFLALLFAAPKYLSSGIEGVTRSEIAQINSGFSGTKYIGSWALTCSSAKAAAEDPATANGSVGRCRMARGYKDKFGQLILAIAFRYAGPGKQLTMIVRYPPVGSKGQYLTLVLATKMSLRLPVFDCTKSACLAVGALIPAAQSLLVAAPQAAVVLPAPPGARQYTIAVRLDGLAPALDGMRRAEL
ncbi:MAG TPA: invasion associated locus B family protein [Rhizomicrobium sp.]|jgi:invasion protein IalB|nr:invasion associated locus B family protein [Rhizomicrobium sp.]